VSNDKGNESFVRWQGRTIEQLGFVNNLLLGLATGILAFQTQGAFNGGLSLAYYEKCSMVLSMLFMTASLLAGCYLAYNRLKSFRLTAKIARNRETNVREGIATLRACVKKLDARTWLYLKLQVSSFALGGLFLVVMSVLRYLQ
jgi:hypothetical protein